MFDNTSETNIENHNTPEAATAELPVRIELCGELVWVRPSTMNAEAAQAIFANCTTRIILQPSI